MGFVYLVISGSIIGVLKGDTRNVDYRSLDSWALGTFVVNLGFQEHVGFRVSNWNEATPIAFWKSPFGKPPLRMNIGPSKGSH